MSFCAFSDAQDIIPQLIHHFPKLSEAGGFELLRVLEGGGKQLDVITAPESAYTVLPKGCKLEYIYIYIPKEVLRLILLPVLLPVLNQQMTQNPIGNVKVEHTIGSLIVDDPTGNSRLMEQPITIESASSTVSTCI